MLTVNGNAGLDFLGWNSWFKDGYCSWAEKNNHPGRVIGMQREVYTVATEIGTLAARVSGKFMYKAQFKRDYPAVGDWVVLDGNAGLPLIKAVLPRKSSFARKLPIKGGRKLKDGMIDGGTTEEQIIAANVDTVFIVTGLDQNFEPRRIERYLTLSANSGADPVLLLNKADLHADPDFHVFQLCEVAREIPVHTVSAETGYNMESISQYMCPGKTVVFIGSSGAGKSSLINHLLGQQRQKISWVSEATGKGRHTTTSAEMIFHRSGYMIIDTPGLRELQLWCDEDAVSQTFEDVVRLESQCKFNDCRHTQEPGCAIRAAVEKGDLSQGRLVSYNKQMRELRKLESKKKQLEARMNKRK